ncbi:SRPBCC family protein [Ferrimicrobium acidiphilum]|uniref:Polyketide cyclase / dehydrase and lipid transport n=1 Tax=Ferrimicrobium acidiphilum DSM 19497 TaxID=1121877 RepID=A0A0D8FYV1_9ACTN|nr:SRPBCC family protein [Ferrimicrobium acidiphilum]KJE77912.1 polyketide cyclase / dehydrase and lipid transport [Ferrimicrobium acidiphilum DSM 19497]MCL5053713.1 SRPBCC family protein [Gammaproteobacteria bacterium]
MDVTSDSKEIPASIESCFEAVIDVESYPTWASDVRSVQVVDRDDLERPLRVAFRTGAFGRSASYTLLYDYSDAPHSVSWSQVAGDITSRMDGRYTFEQGANESTHVTYELLAELVVPLPSFVKRRAEVKIIRTALDDLAERVRSRSTGQLADGSHS